MARFEIDKDFLVSTLQYLIETPSPTGDTDYAIGYVEGELMGLGIDTSRTIKGALVAQLPGIENDAPRALTAHVDTLGAMVKQILPSGRLKLAPIGGVIWSSVESEGVTVSTASGRMLRGSIVLHNGAAHVNREAHTAKRDADSLEVRLDERTSSAEETSFLGVQVGDFVYFDPRFERNESDYIRSRFLDDKACVACLLAALKAIKQYDLTPVQPTTLLFSNFEEVGHGGSNGLPDNLAELVVLDMACIGTGLNGSEHHCSICVMDAYGPYSRGLSNRLRAVAERRGIDLKADVYPHYASDGSPYWRAGGQAEVALIGPGVDTSHGYERTHLDALIDTAQLIAEYLIDG